MNTLTFVAHSVDDTDTLGRLLARYLPDGTVVGLHGTLGAGKTRLVQAIAAACGVPRDLIVSPTFVLCHEYVGDRKLYHLDAYRIKDEDEFLELGPEEYFESSGITLIEWADRVAAVLPAQRLSISIEIVSDTTRKFTLQFAGERLEQVAGQLRNALPGPAE